MFEWGMGINECELCGSLNTYPIDVDAYKCVDCEGITADWENEKEDSKLIACNDVERGETEAYEAWYEEQFSRGCNSPE